MSKIIPTASRITEEGVVVRAGCEGTFRDNLRRRHYSPKVL